MRVTTAFCVLVLLAACGGGGSSNRAVAPPQTPPPAGIDVTGVVLDGPVVGGSLYVFRAESVLDALAAANTSADRAAALAGAMPITSLTRATDGDENFSLEIPGINEQRSLFFIFDAAGASDETFGDMPFNLEAVAVMPAAGGSVTVNITPHTTLIAAQVRNALDPDGDGVVIAEVDIASAITDATATTVAALNTDDLGDVVLSTGDDPTSSADVERLTAASVYLGRLVRLAAAFTDEGRDAIMTVLAADAADGRVDGAAPADYPLDSSQMALLEAAAGAARLGAPDVDDGLTPSCSASARQLRRACEFEVLDEYMVGKAVCADTSDMDAFVECSGELAEQRMEAVEECGDVADARLSLCSALGDQTHEPSFGPAFAANFVNPLAIGNGVAANPLFPLVVGNQWVYEGTFEEDGESITEVITIDVLNETKLVNGITCIVVRDVVTANGELIEDTDDWFAQDVSGNVWYCGEEVKDYETFDGDEPPIPELIAIDGSFKAGRDGDKAGIQLPGTATVGDVFRQEVSVANAEDVIEIISTSGTATTPAASCTDSCVVTRDFSPLDPGVEENKYYLPGVGKILEVDLTSGDRFALVSTNVAP